MADPRFFHRAGPFSLGDIAARTGTELSDPGAGGLVIRDVGILECAGPEDLSVFSDHRYLQAFADTLAAAVVTTRELARHAANGTCLVFAPEPRFAYAQIASLFYAPPPHEPLIDANAQIDSTAKLGAGCRIDAGAVIGRGAEIGGRCHIASNAVVGPGVVLGDDCRVGVNSAIGYALIGSRVEIGTCVSIGGPGFGYVAGARGLARIPQLGRVIIEDDVKIDANCAIDRGASGDTVIGAGTVLDNLVQIGHNVRLGRNCVIAGQSGIAGSTVVGDGVIIGGQVAISDHLTIGAGARIAFNCGVIRDVEAGTAVGGYPAVPLRQWHRQTVALAQLWRRRKD